MNDNLTKSSLAFLAGVVVGNKGLPVVWHIFYVTAVIIAFGVGLHL